MSTPIFKLTRQGIVGNLVGTASYAQVAESTSDPIWIKGEGSGSAVLSGSGATATGQFAVAEGNNTTASGSYSHAEGNFQKLQEVIHMLKDGIQQLRDTLLMQKEQKQ